MSSIDSLNARISRALAAIEQQQQRERAALPLWQQWQQDGELIREGLYRKLALLSEDKTRAVMQLTDALPEDYSEQCARIDRELEQERTPAEREMLTRYHLAFPCEGARERLMQLLERMGASTEDPAA